MIIFDIDAMGGGGFGLLDSIIYDNRSYVEEEIVSVF